MIFLLHSFKNGLGFLRLDHSLLSSKIGCVCLNLQFFIYNAPEGKEKEESYGLHYIDKTPDAIEEDSEEAEEDAYEEKSCSRNCCDNDCECDDCVRCSDRGLNDADDYEISASAA
jgi:hypothetical protein